MSVIFSPYGLWSLYYYVLQYNINPDGRYLVQVFPFIAQLVTLVFTVIRGFVFLLPFQVFPFIAQLVTLVFTVIRGFVFLLPF